jgi:hypothetical protein
MIFLRHRQLNPHSPWIRSSALVFDLISTAPHLASGQGSEGETVALQNTQQCSDIGSLKNCRSYAVNYLCPAAVDGESTWSISKATSPSAALRLMDNLAFLYLKSR